MGVAKQEVHRPGSLKQTNKQHKTGRHRSKGSISSEVKGKVGVKALSRRIKKDLGRDARRHQSSQIRKNKREEVLAQKRNLGGCHSAPILICMIPLQEDLELQNVLASLTNADESAVVASSPCGVTHIRFKQRFSIIIPPVGNLFATLDAAKAATTVLFVASATNGKDSTPRTCVIDDWGREVILPCLAQGLANTIVAVTNMDCLHIKKRQDHKQHVQEAISKWLPEERVVHLDTATDCLNILRKAGSQKQKIVSYRNRRAHLLAEEVKFACNPDSTELGTLMVSGYVRDVPLSVNGLVHIPGLGDFQMSQIDAPEDPFPIEKRQKKHGSSSNAMEDESMVRVLQKADPNKQESLQTENIPDPMDAEQTWPTEEELAQAAAAQKKIVKLVPKGTSEYQAAWIPDEDGEDVSEYSDNGEDGMSIDEAKSQDDSDDEAEQNEEDYETLTVSEAPPDEQRYDQDIDMDEEKRAMEKLKEAKLDAQFPDEVDTPQDIPAKVRFQKYRGLESFRTSPWDAKENLPIDYARIFQFENFERTRKRIFNECQDIDGALPGWYITIYVKNVRRELFTAFSALENRPLIVFGLLPNEQKMSLLNVVLKNANQNADPIKSKERLVFQCGFRRFTACPVFSQHTNGMKHKYERYFQPDSTIVASMYAPVIFPPCPVLCYIEKSNGSLELVATGSVLSSNPDRLVIKRAVLSGHPYKVNKRSAVIRFMFFNREDIKWFRPVQLRTKYGRRGHIKEPLGTHGHMKCVFNGQLRSQDTILMNLYKRVFPKWTYEPLLVTNSPKESETMNIE